MKGNRLTPAWRIAWLGLILAGTPASISAQLRFEVPQTVGPRWFKGNTHAHTALTDGDSPPDTVVTWYRSRGYHFLVITDHDRITDPATLAHHVDSTFILVPGEEVTARYDTLPVHVNGLNLARVVRPQPGEGVGATLRANVDSVRAAGGVPQINHPNFRWALKEQDIHAAGGARLFELFNGHPLVNNFSAGGLVGTEALWDRLLSAGRRIYGVATDDSHHFIRYGARQANPGRGWVVVRARSLTPDAIAQALDGGQFYASTGVELEDVIVTPTRLEIRIRPGHVDFAYTTQFIGSNGRVLAETFANPAVFELKTPERYVRAKITSTDGAVAWVQPVFVTGHQN